MFERHKNTYGRASPYLKSILFGTFLLLPCWHTALADSKTVLANLAAAENQIITSDNRLFVGAQDGLYLVPRNGQPVAKIPVAFSLSATPSTSNNCFFFGLTQIGQYVYASCTPDPGNANSPRYLLIMDIGQPLAMRAFYTVSDSNIFNGVTSDSAGNLYLSSFPVSTGQGRIVKVALSSPTTVESRANWLYTAGKPNGLKTYGATLYFVEGQQVVGGISYLKKVAINSDGSPGTPQIIYATDVNTVMDDIALVNGGILLCTADVYAIGGTAQNRILHLSESGQLLHSSMPLQLPSSVSLERSPNAGALYVTERGSSLVSGSGDVAEYFQSWGLAPRP